MDENKKKKKQKRHKRKDHSFYIIQGVILLAFLAVIFLFVKSDYAGGIFSLRREALEAVENSTIEDMQGQRVGTIYDADGGIIAELKNERNIRYLTSEEIPRTVKDAFVSIEDKRFYKHNGVDFFALTRAVTKLINKDAITQGGSTITQQLARNVFLTHEVSWQRKVKEMFIAWELEKKYTKDEILEFYVNNIFYANNCYGIESASQKYFGKTISECSISEVAFLCAIPNSPSRFDPLENKENTLERRDVILDAMYDNDKISKEEYEAALAETITVDSHSTTYEQSWAKSYVIHCVVEEMMAADGFEFQYDFEQVTDREDYEELYDEKFAEYREKLYLSGYQIYTSIEPEQQTALQNAIDVKLEEYNTKNTNGSYALQCAATCIDNETGLVTAIVGGRSQEDVSYDYNRAYLSSRPPGSAIKPLVVYTPLLERGYTANSIVNDTKDPEGPKNSNGQYSGNISLRTAVEKSKNTVAWAKFNELGAETAMQYLLEMEFADIMPQDYTGSSALGGFTRGASTLEMSAAYTTLANGGVYRRPTCIIRVEDSYGNVVFEPKAEEKQVYEASAAEAMTDILEGVMTNGTAKGQGLERMPSAGKTGTTNENKDGWFAGYTPYYTTSIWVGYDSPRWLKGLTGSAYPAEIWHNFMEEIHTGLPVKNFGE
ncbi:MAG: PBP1A family penicillin-binding protein [Lachnospiraceae bacterium]|nr:PBP1A family penicillin-binding protein [Lachnospiraceae bacterium]